MNPNDQATDEMIGEENPYFGADASLETEEAEGDFGDEFIPDDLTEDDDDIPELGAVEEVEEEEEVPDEEAEVEEAEPADEEAPDDDTSVEEVAEEVEEESPVPKDTSRRSSHIPRTRFDKVNTDLAAAKQRIKDLEQTRPTETVQQQVDAEAKADADHGLEVAKLLGEANNLILDGQTDQAVKLQQQAFEMTQHRASEKAVAQANHNADLRVAREAFDVELVKLEAEFPFLDPDAGKDVYDQSLVNRVASLSDGLVTSENMSQVEALEEAVLTVAARFGVVGVSQTDAGVVETETKAALVERKQAKKTATIKRNTKIAAKQPAKLGGDSAATVERKAPTVGQMTEAEFAAVSEEELQRMRGDYVA